MLASFVLLIRHHLVHLSSHRLDVRNDQLIQIGVRIFPCDTERATDSKLVWFIQLVHSYHTTSSAHRIVKETRELTDMLIKILIDFPSNRQMILLRRRTDNTISSLLICEIRLRLSRVEIVKVGMLDHSQLSTR